MNAVRSPMACGIFQHLAGPEVRATSAGVHRGVSDPFMVAVMNEIGVDLSEFQPQRLEDIRDQSFSLIVSLSPEAHHHAVELTRVMAADVRYWPTLDVAQLEVEDTRLAKLARYRDLRDMLFARVKQEFEITGGPNV